MRSDFLPARPLRERLLDLAVTSVPASDRTLVRDALDRALASGDAVLFLDGLDEAADRSLLLARQIADLLETVHPDTDVLLATRDVSYSHAHELLHFADLRLKPPEHTNRAVKAVLDAVAEARRIANAEAWTKERLEWVERVLHADSQLRETPLLPVLLALLAADSDGDALPETPPRSSVRSSATSFVATRFGVAHLRRPSRGPGSRRVARRLPGDRRCALPPSRRPPPRGSDRSACVLPRRAVGPGAWAGTGDRRRDSRLLG